jgi:Spx/MgsR family transcriptional regulator
MITIYGIRQCDTCRKALKWLDREGVSHRVHDLRQDGLDARLVSDWLASEFAARLVNRRSTTWRTLDEQQKASEGDALVKLLLEHPTLIKRPVVVTEQIVAVGFSPAQWQQLFAGASS